MGNALLLCAQCKIINHIQERMGKEMKKMKKFAAMAAAAAIAVSPMAAFAEDADPYRVCFVARASADTFAAWLTTEMQEAAA